MGDDEIIEDGRIINSRHGESELNAFGRITYVAAGVVSCGRLNLVSAEVI
jgi:hypothetical protein